MVSERKERLSAWMDGQEQDSFYDEMAQDADAVDRLGRYHLIGDAMRNELPTSLNLDIASKVAADLELEPAILAPKATKRRSALPGKVIQLGQRFGQYAIAATVAAVAVVGVQQYGQQPDNPLPVLETTPLLGAPSPASYQVPGLGQQDDRLEKERTMKAQQRRANAFLRDHLLQQRLNGAGRVAQQQGQ